MYSGESGCSRAKWWYSRKEWWYSGAKSFILAKVVVFGQKWLYSGKSGSIRANLLYSDKVIVFLAKSIAFGWTSAKNVVVFRSKSGCFRVKSGFTREQSGSIRAKVVVFRAKVVLFGQKILYSV